MLATAKSTPPTVTAPPRMPFTLELERTSPLAAPGVTTFAISSVAPTERVSAALSARLVAEPSVKVRVEAPAARFRVAKVWALTVVALPKRDRLPPARLTVPVAAKISAAGAPVAVKSSASVPDLTVVAPV